MSGLSSTLYRVMIMWFVAQAVFRKGTQVKVVHNVETGVGEVAVQHEVKLRSLFRLGTPMDLVAYVSESPEDMGLPSRQEIWREEGLVFDWRESNNRYSEITFDTPPAVQRNASLYLHVVITNRQQPHQQISRTWNLVKYFQRPKADLTKSLLTGEMVQPELEGLEEEVRSTPREIVSWWNSNVTLNMVTDTSSFLVSQLPEPVLKHMQVDTEKGIYYPTVYFNDFWTYKEHYVMVNETVSNLTLRLAYEPISLWKWQLMTQMDESLRMQAEWGAMSEADELKRMLSDTNPYLLALTFAVSMLHMVFDFLAFKNDIAFWKNKKNIAGLSVRTIFINFGCQIVIFLYLLDNDTSWMICLSSGVGLIIEGWKITKACKVTLLRTFPFVSVEDKDSYSNETRQHDREAMRYLSYLLYPLVIGYAVYSLMYRTHKSWYSWILSSLTGAVYTFGFIMMTPQLFINYKMKSVAHLPWRVFVYKALNTFIDDLFAFIIKMPIMHRLSCFRDDLVFLIYLYQRWIYRVDPNRPNEYGRSAADYEEVERAKSSSDTGPDAPAIKEE